VTMKTLSLICMIDLGSKKKFFERERRKSDAKTAKNSKLKI
jgi:hypothetical protein